MTRFSRICGPALAGLLCCLAAQAAGPPATVPALTGFPFTNETLHYTLSWPSGLSLGEALMTATRNSAEWSFDLYLKGAVPGFEVADHYHATASPDLCAMAFDRQFTHGSRKSEEHIEFDPHAGVARRETVGGGKSDIAIASCARDALTFLYYARRELGQGRVPPREDVLFGAPYHVRLEYTGAQTVKVGDKTTEADRVVSTLKGPASQISFEMFFARDAARTPLIIRVPLSLGTFSLELAR
jgi:hypothetical protein